MQHTKIFMQGLLVGILLVCNLHSLAQIPDAVNDPAIEQTVRLFLKAVNSGAGKPIEQLSPGDGRQVLTSVQTSVKTDLSGVMVSYKTINVDTMTVNLVVVRPASANGILPAFMFFHGGGWVLGDFPTHERLVRDLVITSGAVAVFVDYARSPEAHFPVAINQAYAATEWVSKNGKEIGVDGSRLAIAGNSVGGNMAAVVAIMAKDKHGPAIRFELLLWPVTDADFDTESYRRFGTQRFLTKSVMEYYWNAYLPGEAGRSAIYASPLRATTDQLKGLPPTMIQVAENDVLRDEGEAYGRKLDEAGVRVTTVRYNGLIYDYGLLNPLSGVPSVQAAIYQGGTELKKNLF